MKEVYKNLDLRNQLTEELKNKWYYKNIKWGLRINKKSVVFDKYFKFVVKYHEYHDETGEFDDESWMTLEYYINGVRDDHSMMYIDDDNKYLDDSADILETVLVYIANYI